VARRDLADKRLAITAILPGMRAYDDLEGPCGAWATLMDATKVRDHLAAGGRIHVAVADGWATAHPAAALGPTLAISSTIQTGTHPGATVIDSQGIWMATGDGSLVPHPRYGYANRPADAVEASEPPC
jgi:hypothetical protein